jgi:formylglycine-generating enzyme required for sulfatase activity
MNGGPAALAPTRDMVLVRGGSFAMGATGFYPEESPVRPATVGDVWIDVAPVTNAEFRRFVADTGHVTVAERPVTAEDYPDADPALLVPGSLVFHRCRGPVDLRDIRRWWAYVPGATWWAPEGPGSDLAGRDDHPVVHIAYEDAEAYARWAGKELPSEAEWEYAARAGARSRYPWGDALEPGRCNTFRGEFPRGPAGTAPVDAFAANAFGLHNVIGNVWEWTADPLAAPNGAPGERAIRGGSYLCHPSHCNRNRLAGRTGAGRPMGHIGFRVAA